MCILILLYDLLKFKYVFALALLFTVLLASYESATLEGCRSTYRNSEGFLEADCTNMNLHVDLLPRLPKDIQIIDFSRNPNLELENNDYLQEYADTLIRLNFSENINYAYGHPDLIPNDPKLLVFSKLINLEELEYSHAELKTPYQWVLPKNLIKYNIDDNKYEWLDVHWCKKLEVLSINDNNLQYLPKFGLPLPPLTKLYAKRNPLNNLTLLDLASFCELSTLELEFPKGSYLAKEEGFCDCMLIKNWTIEVKIKGLENLNCTAPKTNATNKPSCSNDLLEKARKIRKTCPLLHVGESVRKSLTNILKILFFLIMLGILVATWILFIIRRLHLRERFHLPHGTPIKIEEEEEEEDRTISPGSLNLQHYYV